MVLLTTYQGFLHRVEELGFLPMSNILPGFPSLSAETPNHIWHTGLETDPWQWKDRAAEEKQLAYGCILGGHKGFVCARMYPLFYAAYHPLELMPERWAAGTVNLVKWKMWQLFEEKNTMNTSQARKLLNISVKKSGSQVDRALNELQMEYYITVSGNMRKVSIDGHPYGWPSNQYTRVVAWLPESWNTKLREWQRDEARESILDDVIARNKSINRQTIARVLGF
jgi:hypothetical protein